MDLFKSLGVDINDPSTVASIEMYSQLRQITQKLVQIRKKRGMSQNDVAKELMITRQAVSKIEDPNNNPKISTLIGYAIAVDAKIDFNVTQNQPVTGAYTITSKTTTANSSGVDWRAAEKVLSIGGQVKIR